MSNLGRCSEGRTKGAPPVPTLKSAMSHPVSGHDVAVREPGLFHAPELGLLEDAGIRQHVNAGAVLQAAGSRVEHVRIVLDGEIELLARAPRCGRATVALVRSGGVVGDLPVLLGLPMPFDALARRPTVVTKIHRGRWMQLLQESPALSLKWMASLAGRIDAEQRRSAVTTTRPLDALVAFVLLTYQENTGHRMFVRLTHATIAELVGARRQSVTRIVRTLRAKKMISSCYGEIEILDPEGLRALVGPELLLTNTASL
jgi:CRP-like cAMP-binding protein